MSVRRRTVLAGALAAAAALVAPSLARASGMQIFVKTLTGRTVPLEVGRSDTIAVVKRKVADEVGAAADSFDLYFGDRRLEPEKTIADYEISRDAVIEIKELTIRIPVPPPRPTE